MARKVARRSTAPRRKGRKNGNANKSFNAAGPSCMMPGPTRKIYKFERTLYAGNLSAAVADKGWAFSYTLGSFPGASEFTTLFDLYRMTALELTFTMGGTSGGGWDPTLSFLADYDSYSVPTTVDPIAQRPHKRVTLSSANPTYTFKLQPRVMSVLQTSSGTASSGLASRAQFIDCNSSDVVYGGLIGWITNFNTTANVTIAVMVRAKFDFAMSR